MTTDAASITRGMEVEKSGDLIIYDKSTVILLIRLIRLLVAQLPRLCLALPFESPLLGCRATLGLRQRLLERLKCRTRLIECHLCIQPRVASVNRRALHLLARVLACGAHNMMVSMDWWDGAGVRWRGR